MESYYKFKSQILKNHIILSLIFLSFFYVLNLPYYANGYILGAFVSIVNFYLMAGTNEKIFFLGKKLRNKAVKWFFLRYILFALPLIISFKKGYFEVGGTIIGLFSCQIALLSTLVLKNGRDW